MTNDDKVVPITAEARQRQLDMRRLAAEAKGLAEESLKRRVAWNRKFDRKMWFYRTILKVMAVVFLVIMAWGGYGFWQGTYGLADVAIPAECPNAAELRAAFDPFDEKQTVVFMPDGVITDCHRLSQAEADALILKPGVSRGQIYPKVPDPIGR